MLFRVLLSVFRVGASRILDRLGPSLHRQEFSLVIFGIILVNSVPIRVLLLPQLILVEGVISV